MSAPCNAETAAQDSGGAVVCSTGHPQGCQMMRIISYAGPTATAGKPGAFTRPGWPPKRRLHGRSAR